MGVLDKIKNALFEVEYVEVEEPPKKEKKVKEKKIKEKKIKEEKPIAKKVVLPGKRDEKIEEIQEEELRDEDFEIRPKDEQIKAREEFKFMDDNDFKVEDDDYLTSNNEDEPEIIEEVEEKPVVEEVKREIPRETRVSREERQQDTYDYYVPEKPIYSTPHESKPYGMDKAYSVPVHEYGTYEKKEEKTYFKPSPIISPIYGILDKNYKKEDVKEKKEVRITTSYTRSNVSVDDIRNKAYGSRRLEEEAEEVEETNKFEVEEQDDDLLVDLSDRSKPEVKELTMGDAEEYFQDLGLEYNVDYVDVSTDRSTTPKKEEKPKHVAEVKEEVKKLDEEPIEEVEEPIEEKKEEVVIEKTSDVDADDDNLFDLIDSMYEE